MFGLLHLRLRRDMTSTATFESNCWRILPISTIFAHSISWSLKGYHRVRGAGCMWSVRAITHARVGVAILANIPPPISIPIRGSLEWDGNTDCVRCYHGAEVIQYCICSCPPSLHVPCSCCPRNQVVARTGHSIMSIGPWICGLGHQNGWFVTIPAKLSCNVGVLFRPYLVGHKQYKASRVSSCWGGVDSWSTNCVEDQRSGPQEPSQPPLLCSCLRRLVHGGMPSWMEILGKHG